MPERQVKLGSMFYIDEGGKALRGEEGETVKVSPDFVEKFDALNVLAVTPEPEPDPPEEDEEPEPKRRVRKTVPASDE